MKYKLYNENITNGGIDDILRNRGITEIDKWKNADWNDINSPYAFGKDKIEKAVNFLKDVFNWQPRKWNNDKPSGQKICVIVDSDVDGMTSAALIINYLSILMKHHDYTNSQDNIEYILHSGKQHGLQDTYSQISDDIDLVIIPDAATNDIEEIKKLSERDIKVLIMDHHHSDEWYEDNNVVIINNQICDYPNKYLSGVGVTWQVCRAYDDIMGLNFANDFLDLAAVGDAGDMMNYTSIETRAVIKLGLQNLKNPFLYYMAEKNKFSIDKKGGLNYISVAWYIVPMINAVIRSGTMEEKDLVFKSMLQDYAFEKIESGKRGHKGELVPRVEEAVRIAGNVKARQTKLQDNTMAVLEKKIKDNNMLEDSILIFECEPSEVEKNIAGLVANKLMSKYQRPVFVLIKSKTKDDKEIFYRGSARNYGLSEIEDLREICSDSQYFEYCQGHGNAFGVSIPESKVQDFKKWFNSQYKNVSKESVYWVDFVWNKNEINPKTILEIADSKDYWGQDVNEPLICIKDIPLSSCQVQLLSPDKHPTIKIHLDNSVDIMKFGSSEEEYLSLLESNTNITLVGKCNKNEWCGRVTSQIMIEDYELKQEWIF